MNKDNDLDIVDSPDESPAKEETKMSAVKKNFVSPQVQNSLLMALVVVFFVNAIVLGWFGLTINSKLSGVVEESAPQSVDLTLVLAADCEACGKLDTLLKKVKAQNVEIGEENTVTFGSKEADELVAKYALEKLPALVLTASDKIKDSLVSGLEASANLVGDKTLVWEQEAAPYYDLNQKNAVGLIVATYLTDKTCLECYDVATIQRNALAQFGAYINEEVTLDVSDPRAKELISLYQITAVPTAIFSPAASSYPALLQVWKSVGTIENDGSFVFREMSALGGLAYKNLTTGQVVGPTPKTN